MYQLRLISQTGICVTCLVLFYLQSTAQIRPDELRGKTKAISSQLEKFCDSTLKELENVDSATRVATSGSYKKYIDAYFTYLSYDRGTLPTGTSAALDLANNSTQLKLAVSRKIENKPFNGSIILATAGIQAKIENGISNLFNGGTASTGTTFFGNFAFLPGKASYKVRYDISYIDENGVLTSPYDTLSEKKKRYHAYFCEKYNTDYYLKFNALICRWEELRRLLKDCKPECCDKYVLIKEKEEIEKELESSGILEKKTAQLATAMKNTYTDKLYEIEIENALWSWVKFFWVSGGITYTRESYDTYNEGLALAKRFDSQVFGSVGGRITLHWFKEKFKDYTFIGSHYFNISYAPSRINSFTDIKAQDIVRNVLRPSNPPDTTVIIQLSKKAKNVTSKTFKTGFKHLFSTNYTAMLWKKQDIGVNLRGEMQLSSFLDPVYNTHIGILVRLKNNNQDPTDKKSKAKVNFEPFIDLLDLTDAGASGKSVWKNSVIGINTTVPFSKIFFD